jgi:hypothetical protein
MTLPVEVNAALQGWPEADTQEQAFVFLTVDEHDFPHVALLSRAEIHPADDEVLVAVSGTTTRANLRRAGQATLVVFVADTAHYLKLRAVDSREGEGFTVVAFRVAHHKADSVGIPLRPVSFRTSSDLARFEHWERHREALLEFARRR